MATYISVEKRNLFLYEICPSVAPYHGCPSLGDNVATSAQ